MRFQVTVLDDHGNGKVRRWRHVSGDGSLRAVYDTLGKATADLFEELTPGQRVDLMRDWCKKCGYERGSCRCPARRRKR